MRLYIKVQNGDYKKIQKWIKVNLVNSIPPYSDPEKSSLHISSGSKFTHIKFDVFEAEGKEEMYYKLDKYMTWLMREFSIRYLDKCKLSQCWYEYLRSRPVAQAKPINSKSVKRSRCILHMYKGQVVDKELY